MPLKFLKISGYPVDLTIETEEPQEKIDGFVHRIFINGKFIEQFTGAFLERRSYARGFFRGWECREEKEKDDK